ncbi:DUF4328 domain-containing protein [Streptomyces sp. WAC07149]|uniref:DUF4328 domain-containing protein n=1 Tax=Streptomyces sp. WAC07149 TaxID=2487425 RepID=UPI000F77243E|nr:DUF4328 domain-containing protein [Streptomyces sp. WAC07149]RST06559.1 DUF4328 domain-containing protein [Streptomyces sp. WAC07149]
MSFSAPGSPPPPQGPGPQPPYAANPYAAGPPLPGTPYPGQAFPYPPPPPVQQLRSPQGLATALTVLLLGTAVVNVYSAAANLNTWSLMGDVAADPSSVSDDTLDQSDMLVGVAAGLQWLALAATAVVFVIWFYRVRVNGQVFRPDAFTLGSGWAVGSWFVPLGNLFLPYKVARQTWEASVQLAPDGSFRRVSSAPVTSWWLVWVLSLVLDRVLGVVYVRAETPESLGAASLLGVVSDLTVVAAAVLAVQFVRKLTALQNVKATQGPYAAV